MHIQSSLAYDIEFIFFSPVNIGWQLELEMNDLNSKIAANSSIKLNHLPHRKCQNITLFIESTETNAYLFRNHKKNF